nr:unnamed protein product [Callosobruchus analis]
MNQECRSCKFVGHFMTQCRTVAGRRKQPRQHPTGGQQSTHFKKARLSNTRAVEETSDQETDCVFHVDQDETLTCSVGGVNADVLIDSDSSQLGNPISQMWDPAKAGSCDIAGLNVRDLQDSIMLPKIEPLWDEFNEAQSKSKNWMPPKTVIFRGNNSMKISKEASMAGVLEQELMTETSNYKLLGQTNDE